MLQIAYHRERQHDWNRELARKLERARLRTPEPEARPLPRPLLLSVRAADDEGLTRLAALNEAPAPAGPHLVASVDGEVIAARALETERVLTDPFRRTGHLVRLLALHAKWARTECCA